MTRTCEILLAVILCWPLAGRTAVVTGLYAAEVPVPDQSDASQRQGASAALLNVLVKLTGDRDVQGRAGAATLLEHPEQYVQQYKFLRRPVIRNNQLSLDQQLYLWVSFNANTLDKALQDYAVPEWGRIRPATLVWLVTQQGPDRVFVGLEDEQGYMAMIDARAQQRGIPIEHPLLDNTDRQAVKESDVVGGFLDPVRQASQRYTPDAVLLGNFMPVTAGSWEAHWTLLISNEPITWTATGDNAAQVLQAGIDRLADELATRFAHTTTVAGASGVEIEIKDINNFDQYSTVLKYLRTLNSVVDVKVKSVAPGSVTYSITATGGELAVARAIDLGKILESLSGSGSPYRLR
jgi:hypothetical protein